MATFKLGIDNCFARKRYPTPDDWIPIVAERFKVKYVEFTGDLLDPFCVSEPALMRVARETATKAKAAGLEIYDYYTGVITHCLNLLSHPDPDFRQDGIRWCEGAMRVTKELGARCIGGHYDTIRSADIDDPKRYAAAIDNLIELFKQLSVTAKEIGLESIMWEQMYTPCEVPYTIEQSRDIFERVNDGAAVPILLTVDVGHSCCQNFPHAEQDRDPYEWLRQLGHLSPVIHIQQSDGLGSHHWPFTKKHNEKGIIHAEKVLEALEASGSDENYLVLEIFHSLAVTDNQMLDELEESVEYWKEYVTE